MQTMDDRAKIVRVEKKKGSLGFSIKGGVEHGIPIVVSEIDQNGPSSEYSSTTISMLWPCICFSI